MIAISGSLALLTNLVIAWNTQRMQTTLDRRQLKGQGIGDDWLRRLGPEHFAHVNFRGTLSFPVDRYRDMHPRCRAVATHGRIVNRVFHGGEDGIGGAGWCSIGTMWWVKSPDFASDGRHL